MYAHKEARLIYLAHPRTASTATSDALIKLGFELYQAHHDQFRCLPTLVGPTCREDWHAFTVVRNHFDTAVSWLWRRTIGAGPWTRENFHWALTPPVNRWTKPKSLWHLHSKEADEILKFEELPDNLEALLRKYNIHGLDLKRRNESVGRNGRHYREFIDPESREYIEDRFGEEMEQFGYEF